MPQNNWTGYDPKFFENFIVPLPDFSTHKSSLAINQETGKPELPFIHFSSFQFADRRLPLFTASNMFREKWMQASAEGTFQKDDRIMATEQLSTALYKAINTRHEEPERKVAKGHLTRREDVQWDTNMNLELAKEASTATFFYTNAIPQHQSINNGVWKKLENSILAKGRTKNPRKASVFTGPIFSKADPLLVIPNSKEKIKCPLRFWKVIYYVNDSNELRYSGFIMSHKDELDADKYTIPDTSFSAIVETLKHDKPFLEFDEKETYQVSVKMIEKLTGLKFHPAIDPNTTGPRELTESLMINEDTRDSEIIGLLV